MLKTLLLWICLACLSLTGCDRLYGILHKPGGEEWENLGKFVFNEYSPRVEELQKILKFFGYPLGQPDGKFGSTTRDMVERFQKDEQLPMTRFVDKATWDRMHQYTDIFMNTDGSMNIKALQTALKKAEFLKDKVDGILGPKTQAAIKDFQREHQLEPDGFVGLQTIKFLLKYMQE